MIDIRIPGYGVLALDHLVLDYNGTLACDGELIDGVGELLTGLADKLAVHVVTADTFGKAKQGLSRVPCTLSVLGEQGQDAAKLEYVRRLGSERTVCIGNGRNDRMMIEGAALGVAVVQSEGAASETVAAADVVCPDILTALRLLLNPLRLMATLRC
jgi:soluble P-type ATPase